MRLKIIDVYMKLAQLIWKLYIQVLWLLRNIQNIWSRFMSPYYYRLSTNYSPIKTEEMSPGQSIHMSN